MADYVEAAVYCRLSEDRKGTFTNVRDQERRCRDLANRLGWRVVEVFVDNDLTAAGRKANRPDFKRLMTWIREGQPNGRERALVIRDQDRLVREPRELEDLLELCEDVGFTRIASVEGDLDLGSGRDVFMARIRAAVAADEIASIKKRLRMHHERLAAAGKWRGGRRPYGYAHAGLTDANRKNELELVPQEAARIRDAAERVLKGESLTSICREWTDQGVPTPTGRGQQWYIPTLRGILTSPTIAGLRSFHGEVVGEATWEPIIDRDTHEALVKVINQPSRLTNTNGDGKRKALLSGILHCSRCKRPMASLGLRNGKPNYGCYRGNGGCKRTSIILDTTDSVTLAAVAKWLSDADNLAQLLSAQGDQAEASELLGLLREDERALTDLSNARYVQRAITDAEFFEARAHLTDRIERTKAKLARSAQQVALPAIPEGSNEAEIRDELAAMPVAAQRATILSVIDAIWVGPAQVGLNGYDASRLSIDWRY